MFELALPSEQWSNILPNSGSWAKYVGGDLAPPEGLLHWERSICEGGPTSVWLFDFGAIAESNWSKQFVSRRRDSCSHDAMLASMLHIAEFLCGGDRDAKRDLTGQTVPWDGDDVLCVFSGRDDRIAERPEVVLFAAWNYELDCLESFCVREEVRRWPQELAARHLAAVFYRHVLPICAPDKNWRQAFSRIAERNGVERVCRALDLARSEGASVSHRVVELLEIIADSIGEPGASSQFAAERFAVPFDRESGGASSDDDSAVQSGRCFTGFVIRDRACRLLSLYLVVPVGTQAVIHLRKQFRSENRLHNLLLVYAEQGACVFELWLGRQCITRKVRSARFGRDALELSDLLAECRFCVPYPVGNPMQLAAELAGRAGWISSALAAISGCNGKAGRNVRVGVAIRRALDGGLEVDALAQAIVCNLFAARWIHSTERDASALRFTRNVALRYGASRVRGFGQLHQAILLDEDDPPSDLAWLIDETIDLFDRVDLRAVFAPDGSDARREPIVHFYELLLQALDPKLRMLDGVFYTPRPVVSYIVRSVHELLQAEFGLEDGLADTSTWADLLARHSGIRLERLTDETEDEFERVAREPFVQILDPAMGTGNFLLEVIEVIHRFLCTKWTNLGLAEVERVHAWNEYVPKHLLPRLHADELMLAPYVIARMTIERKLAETGYRAVNGAEPNVRLANALEPVALAIPRTDDTTMGDERQADSTAKQRRRITVIVGNPPYSGHSRNNSIAWIRNLVKDYTRDEPNLHGPGQGKWLQDDYVKFLRFGQYLTTRASVGILAMVTNHRYLTNRTFRGMRRSWCDCYPTGRILDLHGNRAVREVSPDGVDENVFDIEQGVAIGIFLRGGSSPPSYAHSDLWGSRTTDDSRGKLQFLANHSARTTDWVLLQPGPPNWAFSPAQDGVDSCREEFDECLNLLELMPGTLGPNGKPQSGIATMQDGFAIGFSPDEVEAKVERFLNTTSREQASASFGTLCNPKQWDYEAAKRALGSGEWKSRVAKIWFMPFDVRYTVYDRAVAVHLRRRLSDHLFNRENLCLVIGESGREISGDSWDAVCCVSGILQLNFFRRNGSPTLPLYLYDSQGLPGSNVARRVNLATSQLRRIAERLGRPMTAKGMVQGLSPEAIVHYAYAVLHSPMYRTRYAAILKQEFPRLPITAKFGLFRALAECGRKLVALHLLDVPIDDCAGIRLVGADQPRVESVVWSDGCVWLDKGRVSGFEGVTRPIWDWHVGGYRICQKWLKDRRQRNLSVKDVVQFRRMVAAVSRTISIMAEIDRLILGHGGWLEAFGMHAIGVPELGGLGAAIAGKLEGTRLRK